ncbi:MAG: hypothetical protein QT05_C0052G0007 [archaeon GW2011_AR13]|nr:MAG: hypothetical protein QT05_C0052G0007 [archaeon GW2011_AR13]HIG94241.1 hypothetical protein [Nanoarchaeota archaeon]HIH63140.1 hypothetical protein [Nanoarchaeota archaeon]HIJ10405.1 hypothetical protein [Nanoarchaeota archaeon]
MKDNFVIYFALFMTSFIVYSYYLSVFLETHGGWILLTLICIFMFLIGDFRDKRRELNEILDIKDRKKIRIDFWK